MLQTTRTGHPTGSWQDESNRDCEKQRKGQRLIGWHSLRKEGRSSGLAVQPQVMRLMRVSRLGMSAGRLSRPVSGRDPRRTLNMICMGLVASAHRVNKKTMSECWILSG